MRPLTKEKRLDVDGRFKTAQVHLHNAGSSMHKMSFTKILNDLYTKHHEAFQ
jgi:hypothetical protein